MEIENTFVKIYDELREQNINRDELSLVVKTLLRLLTQQDETTRKYIDEEVNRIRFDVINNNLNDSDG